MNAFWVSLKENVKCGNKLTDVVIRQQPAVRSGKENRNMNNRDNNDDGHSNPLASQASLVATTPSMDPPKLHELSIGDPSRKIVEMIFHKAWMNTSTPQKKVRTVFKVSISPEMLERFENYREVVKKKACEQNPRHPRSIVDGNELLRFYGTTMRCFQGKSVQKVKYLCNDPSCSVCQTIQFNFDTEFSRMSSARAKTERSAVIVCRIIAGTSVHEVNGQIEGSCSNGVGKMQFSLDKFVDRNPSAILPCFVLVFD
ncbi:uncharacterized protein LOC114717486 isoform X2 [Neltuma alba]|uniref:uncharacterized protein LOC114717486 isoform X2 n=1 Tax=Neltuma alba TaxID=207710 RepID=UPI0010A3BDAC|nr:uncharacterized protein LOC114717486 isoform X2 [Prosopis alba]